MDEKERLVPKRSKEPITVITDALVKRREAERDEERKKILADMEKPAQIPPEVIAKRPEPKKTGLPTISLVKNNPSSK